jgi:hypothetical protein
MHKKEVVYKNKIYEMKNSHLWPVELVVPMTTNLVRHLLPFAFAHATPFALKIAASITWLETNATTVRMQ